MSASQPVLIGPAFTLRYIPAREDLNKLEVFRNHGHPQRKAVEDCPPGAVLVMDSRTDARAASAGAILGDADGVIVIPAELADGIADETFEMTAYADFVTEQVHAGRGISAAIPRRTRSRWPTSLPGEKRKAASSASPSIATG